MAFLLRGVGAFSVGASGRRGKRLAGQVTPMTPGLKLRGEIGRRESLGFWLRLAKTRRVAPAVGGDFARHRQRLDRRNHMGRTGRFDRRS
jgi:hypothetical protein